ncbi:MAG: hypothetical protein AMJ53_06370 [Gammaproteobacteria bacterium SG8_11]|nr:MAG: hypothetical protein AMJ53_06370 [Gammaproteobacteria bacterium SG8_11]
MKKLELIWFALTLLMLGCGSVMQVADLQSMQAQEQHVTPFLFEYRFSESPPNPGRGAEKKEQFLKVGLKGEFIAREKFPARGHLGYAYSKSGMLTESQLIQIKQIIERLDLPSIPYSEVNLGREGIEYGWGGYLTYVKDGKTYRIKFSAQHSQSQMIDAQIKARFSAFMRDMDDFFLAEMNY